MQLVAVTVAGGVLAWSYLAALDALVFGRRGSRMPLLLAIVAFIEITAVAMGLVWFLADGRLERLAAGLAGFIAVRVLLCDVVLKDGDDARGARAAREALREQPLDRLA